MSHSTSVSCFFILLTFTLGIDAKLIKPEEAKKLALKLVGNISINFDDHIYDNLNYFYKDYRKNISKTFDDNHYSFIDLVNDFQEFDFMIEKVNKTYEQLTDYARNSEEYELYDMIGQKDKILKAVLDFSLYVETINSKINDIKSGESSIFNKLAYNRIRTTNCVTSETSERLIYKLHNILVFTEIESVWIQLYSIVLLKNSTKSIFRKSEEKMINGFMQRLNRSYRSAEVAIKKASAEISKCDSQNLVVDLM